MFISAFCAFYRFVLDADYGKIAEEKALKAILAISLPLNEDVEVAKAGGPSFRKPPKNAFWYTAAPHAKPNFRPR